jgi:uncharacterized damage-inducible protein DinB
MSFLRVLPALVVSAAALLAADAPTAAKVFDTQLKGLEGEFVPLVEAMPAEKFNFAPKDGAFQGVRSFGMQAKHAAFVLYSVSSAMLGEKNPSEGGKDENGPAKFESKAEIVQYVKEAFAYAHKAVGTLTNANLMEETTDPFNAKGKRARVDSAGILLWHTFDHYGQMVEYLRLNNIVPPASR